MRKILIAIFILLCFGFVLAEKIVVWNLEPQSGVSEKEAVTVTSILTSEIESISGNKVVSESELKSVIDGEAMKISCGADDNSCIAEIGAALGAPLSVSGILSKMGDYWVINVQLVDVRKVEVKKRVTKRFKGEENTLIESLTPIVCELFAKENCLEEKKPAKEVVSKEEKVKETEKKTESVDLKIREKKEPVSWKKVAGWTFTVSGAVLLGGGIASNVVMVNARDDFTQTGTGEDKFKLWRGLSIAGYVSGSVLLAGGITLFIIDSVKNNKKDRKKAFFYLLPNKDGVIAGLQGSW